MNSVRDSRKEPDEETDCLARAVVDAAMEVHRCLGPGFLESVYEEALCAELRRRGVPYVRQKPVAVIYKGETIGETRLDLLADDRLIVEIKAVSELAPIHRAQVISYLKATGQALGLLINFNVVLLKSGIKRVVVTNASA